MIHGAKYILYWYKIVIISLEWSVCPSLTQFYLMVVMYLHLLPKVQLHVSALDNSHLQVVHESLENSYTRFNVGCTQYGGDCITRS